jgi:hypothetical protein
MTSASIALIDGLGIVFFLWCAFAPVEPYEQTEPLGLERAVNRRRENPVLSLCALGGATLCMALLVIEITRPIAALIVSGFTP